MSGGWIGQEAAMCHAVRVRLSPTEAKAARRLSVIMVPVYASLALIALAAVALTSPPRPGEAVAVASDASQSPAGRDKAAD
jgi:hypothetical protein